MRSLAALGVILLLATGAGAATWSVERDGSGDFATIQPALDAAVAGDTILIGPGEYTEAIAIRPPGWADDIQSYADVRCDDLTIIGAGAEITVIGPPTYEANAEGDPAGLSYGGGRALTISDLGIRNCYAMFVVGTVFMDRCHFTNNMRGLVWEPRGPGGWVRDSVFETTQYIFDAESFEIGYGGLGSDIVLERCRFGIFCVVRAVDGMVIRDSDLTGMHIYSGGRVQVERCRAGGANSGIVLSMGSGNFCSINDSEVQDPLAALMVTESSPGGNFSVHNSRLTGGSYGVLWLQRFSGPSEVHGCDLIQGSGPVVRCDANGTMVTHDLRNNYWGTTDEEAIRSWIIDRSDAPNIGATVLFSPFAGQSVPTEATSWGGLKALFR